MSLLLIALLVVALFFGGVAIIKKSLGLVEKILDKADTALDVSDIYLQNWAEDARDAAAIASAKRKNELQDELAKVNKNLASSGKKPIQIPSTK